jgi:glutamine synthetase adenylyltransferase
MALRDESLQRLLKLLQRTNAWVEQGRVSEEAALRWIDWMAPLLRRETYLALLIERPRVHAQLLRLLGMARWPATYVLQHPGVIDELAGDALGRPTKKRSLICCAVRTMLKYFAPWHATWKAASRSSKWPMI